VKYRQKLWANNQTHTAMFWENVEVIHLPVDQPYKDLVPDPEKLPPGGLYLQADILKVLTSRAENGTTNQEMTAQGKVMAKLQEFWARADIVMYNQAKDQLILEATGDNKVTIYHRPLPGERPKTTVGKKFIYNRKTGELKGDKIRSAGD